MSTAVQPNLPPDNPTPHDHALPTQRPQSNSSNRPRPVSMPPQTFNNPPSSSADARDRAPDDPSQRRRHRDEHHTSSSRSRGSNRILGDYTLSKTLGAGSMGKVKLATHNITGEKVGLASYFVPFLVSNLFFVRSSFSLPSKSSPACTPTRPRRPTAITPPPTPQHGKPPRTPRKKFEPSARLPSPCSYIIPISAACAR